MDDWRQVAEFLATPQAYHRTDAVEVIDTSISKVFLAGEHAYKLHKPLKLGFLDFSTLELRHEDCLREVALNRRTAAELYLDTIAVTRESDGRLMLAGGGMPVEWLVKMRRFDIEATLDRMASRGAIDLRLIEKLARAIAAFHQSLAAETEYGGAENFRKTLLLNDGEYRNFAGAVFSVGDIDRLRDASLSTLGRYARLLDARKAAGWVRHCHGDLHLGNICMLNDAPVLFDCIEFSDRIAKIDILYDLAFLLMDLWRMGLRPHANHCLNQYLAHLSPAGAGAAIAGLALLPLFLSCRAGVRAFVMARTASSQPGNAALIENAREYFRLAENFLRPAIPRLIAVGGLSGSGKSVLARQLAPLLGAAPGALVLRTDEIRKQLAGVAPQQRLGADAYTVERSAEVYASLLSRARIALQAGQSVITDAVYARPEERAAIEAVAQAAGVDFQGVWLEAPAEILLSRVTARQGDASDADAAIVRRQLGYDTGNSNWSIIDASGTPEQTFMRARSQIGA